MHCYDYLRIPADVNINLYKAYQLYPGLVTFLAVLVLLETLVLMLMKHTTPRLNFIAAIAANLASYLLLILPAYLILLAP